MARDCSCCAAGPWMRPTFVRSLMRRSRCGLPTRRAPTERRFCGSRTRLAPTAGRPIRANGKGASRPRSDRRLLLRSGVARGVREDRLAAALATEDVAAPAVLGLEAEIVRLLGIDFHTAHRIGLVERVGFVRHGAPPEGHTRKRRGFRRAADSAGPVLALLFELALDRVAVLLRSGTRGLALRLLGGAGLRPFRLLLLLVHELADLGRRGP